MNPERGVREDAGFASTEWVLGVAIIILPVMMLVGVLPGWASRHDAAGAAAREGARSAALAIDSGQAEAAGITAATSLLEGRGIDTATVRITVSAPSFVAGRAPRQGAVEVSISISGESVTVPGVGLVSAPTVGAAHVRQLNPFRSQE